MQERAFDGDARPEFWLSHVRAGVVLTVLACALGLVYVMVDPSIERRVLLAALLVGAASATVGLLALPLRSILAHRRVAWFFYAWSGGAAAFTTVGCLYTGNSLSPFIALYFLMLVYAATAYPPHALVRVAGVIVGLYLVLAVLDGSNVGANVLLAGALALTAWMASIASRNQWTQLQEQMALARVDGLTGCLNHRAFREVLEAEVDRSRRLGHPVSLLMVDLDEFKQVNDTHGHVAGDELLAETGTALRSLVRSIDTVGRIGGDEFAVILVETDVADAMKVGERICDQVRGSGTGATVSVGVASAEHDDTAISFLREADAALYDAKRAGRDRVRGRETDTV
ncbi:MAG: diguanylate cyclase [Acidimicrobiales bacterium]